MLGCSHWPVVHSFSPRTCDVLMASTSYLTSTKLCCRGIVRFSRSYGAVSGRAELCDRHHRLLIMAEKIRAGPGGASGDDEARKTSGEALSLDEIK